MPTVVLLLGPTAVGKSEIAIQLALKLDGEIISADSRAIYKGMNIGTAKPLAAMRRNIRHHLLDIKEPHEPYNAMDFRKDAQAAIEKILNRNKCPIIVGGSTLYIEALTGAIFEGPPAHSVLRRRLKQQPLKTLYRRLARIDPKAAKRIHPNDEPRIIRALEVYELTGVPISELQQASKHRLNYRFIKIGLRMRRKELYRRIDERVDAQMARGLLDEAKTLKKRLTPEMQAYKTIGYQELFEYLDGHCSLAQAVEAIKKNTRHLAKRQLTFFKRDKEIFWIDVTDKTPPKVAEEVLSHLASLKLANCSLGGGIQQ